MKLKRILIIPIFILFIFLLTSCFKRPIEEIDFDGLWKCEEYNIIIDFACDYGYMKTDEKTYEFELSWGSGGSTLVFSELTDSINNKTKITHYFEATPDYKKKEDVFYIDVTDCKISEIANKTLKFIHISKEETEDNPVFKKINSNKKWINDDGNIKLYIYNEYGKYDSLKNNFDGIGYADFSIKFMQDYKRGYFKTRFSNKGIEYEDSGIFEVTDCEEGLKIKILDFYDETYFKIGQEIILKVDN